jgi:L-malate glycosyltransferase
MRIVVLCPYPIDCSPSQRLKFEQYYPSWRGAGYDVDIRPFWDDAAWRVLYQPGRRLAKVAALLRGYGRRIFDLRAARRADVVYLHLEAAPLGPPLIERQIARDGVPIIYDVDDLRYLPHSSASNTFMSWLRSGTKILDLMRLADEVVVCTDHLREVAEERNPHVTLISSTIDTSTYAPKSHAANTGRVVVGWSGSHSTAPYLHLLDDALREVQASDGIRVRVIGEASFDTPGLELEAQDWRLETEVEDLSSIDIGLYPLPDTEWVLGKSGLKALQYMALGIPAIAQWTPVNAGIIDHGCNGFLAKTCEDWVTLIQELVRDPALRARIGTEGRRTVEERYSIAVTAPRYLEVLERATSSP